MSVPGPLLFTNVRLVDPEADDCSAGWLFVRDGRIAGTGHGPRPHGIGDDAAIIDGRGALLAPGLVDYGVFRIDRRACHFGGITRAALMPDGAPPLDDPALVERAAKAGKPDLWVHPLAAATRRLDGTDLAEIALMAAAGARAIATGRAQVGDAGVMHRLLQYAAGQSLVTVIHAEDAALTRGAVATDGVLATRYGLPSAPAIAEALAIDRDAMLAHYAGAAIHVRQVTTRAGLDAIRRARSMGVRISCGITPAHLFLSDLATSDFRSFAHLSPPLRSEEDRQACIAAVVDGTIDIIASGHDPRGPEDKRLPFAEALPGMAGAETLLALSLALVRDHGMTLPALWRALAQRPARLLDVDAGSLRAGTQADLVLVDPDAGWQIRSERMAASAGNTPFDGLPVSGRVIGLWKGGARVGARDADQGGPGHR